MIGGHVRWILGLGGSGIVVRRDRQIFCADLSISRMIASFDLRHPLLVACCKDNEL